MKIERIHMGKEHFCFIFAGAYKGSTTFNSNNSSNSNSKNGATVRRKK